MLTNLPQTMRAVQHSKSTSTLCLVNNARLPQITGSQHLIRISACAPCAGELTWPRPPELIVSCPGTDASGTVVSAPPTSKFQAGDEVYYRSQFPHPGSMREYSVAEDGWMALKPNVISMVEAASVPVSALTAWQGLFEEAKLDSPSLASVQSQKKNIRILVNGASGGCGIWFVQLAKLIGATVIATCSTANVAFVKRLGADEIIDYTKQGPQAWAAVDSARKVDVAFDCVGRPSRAELWHTIRPGGKFFTIVPPDDMQFKFDLDTPETVDSSVKGKFFIMHPDGEQLGKITELIDEGKCRAVVDSVWKLEEFEEVFERVESGRAVGKAVVKIGDS